MPSLPYVLALTLILLTTASLRLIYILPALHRNRRPRPRKRTTPTHLLIILGSGGHTAEMLSCLTALDPTRYTYRSYVIGSGDDFSAERAREFERGIVVAKAKGRKREREREGRRGQEKDIIRSAAVGDGEEEEEERKGTSGIVVGSEVGDYSIHTVPRARRIHQSLLTAPLSSFRCFCACLQLLYWHPNGYPDLVLANGPATSLVLILASTVLRYFSFLPRVGPARRATHAGASADKLRVIYVESWARVRRPSLSGRIIVWCGLCDRVLVQWKSLQDKGWGEYRGVLVR